MSTGPISDAQVIAGFAAAAKQKERYLANRTPLQEHYDNLTKAAWAERDARRAERAAAKKRSTLWTRFLYGR